MSNEFVKQEGIPTNFPSAVIELPRIDAEELREELPEGKVNIETKPGSSAVAHDAMTVLAIVLLSKDILKVLATFIVRHLKRNRISFNLEITKPDGTKITKTYYSDETESSSDDKVIESLEKLLGTQSDLNLDAFSQNRKGKQ